MPKQRFITMACYSKLHAMLWRLISVKLNISEKITELEIMALKCEKIEHVFKPMELMFDGELATH